MKVAIHQPNFMPWRGWFAKMYQADLFILLDDVQFEKGGWTNRTRIPCGTPKGLLSLPVHATGTVGHKWEILPINKVALADGDRWRRKMRETLRHTYARTPGWSTIAPWFDPQGHDVLGPIPGCDTAYLSTVNERLISLMSAVTFKSEPPLIWASDLRKEVWPATAGLAQLLHEVGATTYLCGRGSVSYQQDDLLKNHGIKVKHAQYSVSADDPEWGLSMLHTIAHHPFDVEAKLAAFAV